MTLETLLRLALVPAAVWVASIAARRWGHRVSGYLGGLPLIGGPVTLFLALDLGPAFAARSALFTLGAIAAQAAHLVTFAHVARRGSWFLALVSAWTAFAAVSTVISFIPLRPFMALCLAIGGLLSAWRWLPRAGEEAPSPRIPPAELKLRLVAAFALAALIVWSAPVFGPVVSGILLSMPITGSIIPPFTLALYGWPGLTRLLRGFIVGLSGFTTFFAVLAWALPVVATAAAFSLAVAFALIAVFAVDHIARRRSVA